MPKVRQRDPYDKVKTKGKKYSKNRRKQSNVSRQMQAAVEQKVKQSKEHEASNEAATTTTEQAVVDTVAGAAQLSGRAANMDYDKAIRQHSAEPAAPSGDEPYSAGTSVPQESLPQPETDYRNPPQYTEQGRHLAVQEYANSHYGRNISPAPVSEPVYTDSNISTGVQPKERPSTDTTARNLPKSRDYVLPESSSHAVDMGRKYAVRSFIKAKSEQREIPHTQVDLPATNISTAQPENGPKMKPVTEPSQKNTPKTKDTIRQPSDPDPIELGRKYAVQSQAQSLVQQQPQLDPENSQAVTNSGIKPKTKSQTNAVSKLAPKTKDTSQQPVTNTVVEQGRRLAIENYVKVQAEKAATYNDIDVVQLGEQLLPRGIPQNIPDSPNSELKTAQVQTGKPLEKVADKGVKVKKNIEKPIPKQKPKSAPKTRSAVEALSPRAVRPEKVNQVVAVLTPAQKATEMGRRKFMKEAQKQLAIQAQKAAKATANLAKKAANAILKAIQATVSMLAGIFGGVGIVVILLGILLIGAILASPFGILFANEPSPDAIPLSSAVAQISMEFSTKLNELQEGEYENITIDGEPPEWIEVIAVFACHVAGGEDSVDVMVLDEEKIEKLRTVFWDMCVITVEEETKEWTGPTTPTDVSTEPTVNLTITIEAKTADDMRTFYSFTESQNDALTELLAEDEMLNSLIGDLDVSQGDALEVLNGIPGEVSETRKAVVCQALTLVGKVNYFWGGKSLVIGWDNRWGQPTEVWAAGSPTTGTIRPYGLDCSGFVDWVFYNVSGGSYIMGHGGGVATQHVYCQDIPWDQAQPGDLMFYPDDSHAGIVGGWDDAGNMLVIHCASGRNNVVVTGSSGFSTIGRPYYYGE